MTWKDDDIDVRKKLIFFLTDPSARRSVGGCALFKSGEEGSPPEGIPFGVTPPNKSDKSRGLHYIFLVPFCFHHLNDHNSLGGGWREIKEIFPAPCWLQLLLFSKVQVLRRGEESRPSVRPSVSNSVYLLNREAWGNLGWFWFPRNYGDSNFVVSFFAYFLKSLWWEGRECYFENI